MGILINLILSISLFFSLVLVKSQSPTSSPTNTQALNSLLQDYAYQAFIRPKTGVIYDGTAPSNLTGIQVSGLRLRSGSLRAKGVSKYKEFTIPKGVIVQPYVERLVFVYHNLGNWSNLYYPPPNGYMYLAPVIGLLAYDAFDLTAKNLPELEIRASNEPILIKFSDLRSIPDGSNPRCVSFDINGSINFTSVTQDNMCSTFQHGHFSIVVESIAPSPSFTFPTPTPPPHKKNSSSGNNSKVWIIVGSVLGGFLLLILLGFFVLWAYKCKHKKKMHQMERAADAGEALKMTNVGSTKAPAASVHGLNPPLKRNMCPNSRLCLICVLFLPFDDIILCDCTCFSWCYRSICFLFIVFSRVN